MILLSCAAALILGATPPAPTPPAPTPPAATPPAPPRKVEPVAPKAPLRPREHSVNPVTSPPRGATPGADAPSTPPFVPNVGVNLQGAGRPQGELPPAYFADATQWVVEPGTSWRLFADKVKPGDEILFTAWFHIPQDFDGLQGTAERPIFIRSRDAQPGGIACEGFGFRFNRPKHVVVENILFLNASDAGIQVDGSPIAGAAPDAPLGKEEPAGWNAEMVIRNCTLAGTRTNAAHDAIRLRNVQNVRVDSIRVDGWNDSALEIESCRRILVRGLMMVPIEKFAQQRGIAILGPSADISINASSFNKGMKEGLVVGTAGVPDRNGVTAVPPVQHSRIDRCLFDRVGDSVVIVNVRDFTVSRVTFVDPIKSIYSIPEDAGIVEGVLIEKALASWPPGKLAKFSPHPERIVPTSVTLGDNLWYSAELPDAFEVIGKPFGFQGAAQVFDVNPAIDLTTMRPQSMDGVRYGAMSIAATAKPAPDVGPDVRPAPIRPAPTNLNPRSPPPPSTPTAPPASAPAAPPATSPAAPPATPPATPPNP